MDNGLEVKKRLAAGRGPACRALCLVAIAVSLSSACASASRLPWSEDFSDAGGGWLTESDESALVSFDEGSLRLLVLRPNLLAGTSASKDYSDVHLLVEATQAGGPDDNEYGMRVRITGDDQYYAFAVSGDGYFRIGRYDQGEWTSLTGGWRQSDAVIKGASTNVLEVICQGTQLTFVVNGMQLAQVEDLIYGHGDVGLYAGSFFESGVDIRFDNLSAVAP